LIVEQNNKNQPVRMIFRVLLIIFSLLGISATFMPWLHYPKAGGVFYGYMVDGVLTGFLFLIILVFSLVVYRKQRFPTIASIIFGLLGLLLAFWSYDNIRDMEAEKINFTTNDPVISAVSAGFHQGIGMYVFGIAGLGVLLTLLFGWLLQRTRKSKTEGSEKALNRKMLIYVGAVVLIGAIIFSVFKWGLPENNTLSKEELEKTFTRDIKIMGTALINRDYNKFIKYNHPIMIQSYGGRSHLYEILDVTRNELDMAGTEIKEVRFDKILDLQKSGNDIQAVLLQTLTLTQNNQEQVQIQKMLAVSEDGGANWYYINIEGKTKDEIKQEFPALNEKLKF
jgi:hypothetical protein